MKKLLFFLIIPFLNFGQQLNTENIFYDGHNREYIIYIPQTYSSSNPEPILFAFHGGSGYADEFMNYEADFRSIADTAGFILVYPQALEDPNDGNSTNWLHKEPTSILGFHYFPEWIDNELFLNEYQLKFNDTVFSLKTKIDYIVGSRSRCGGNI